jgi:hypothetical protein
MRTVCGAQADCSEAPQREKLRPGIVPWQRVEQCNVTPSDISMTFSSFISLRYDVNLIHVTSHCLLWD